MARRVQIPSRQYRELVARAKREKRTVEELLDEVITKALAEEMRWS